MKLQYILNTRLSSPGRLHFGVSDGGYNNNAGAYPITVTQPVPVPERPVPRRLLCAFRVPRGHAPPEWSAPGPGTSRARRRW